MGRQKEVGYHNRFCAAALVKGRKHLEVYPTPDQHPSGLNHTTMLSSSYSPCLCGSLTGRPCPLLCPSLVPTVTTGLHPNLQEAFSNLSHMATSFFASESRVCNTGERSIITIFFQIILCVWVFSLYVCLHTTRMPGAQEGWKRASEFLALELQL